MLQCFADAWTGIAEPRGDKRIRSGVVVAQLVAAPQRYEQEQLAHELQSFEAGIATPTAETLAALPEAAEAEVAPVPTVPRLPRESVDHVVATGEDLLAIARRYAVDVEDLARKNGLGIHDALEPGSTVTVSAMPRDVVPR
jgi:LysM repeat protein